MDPTHHNIQQWLKMSRFVVFGGDKAMTACTSYSHIRFQLFSTLIVFGVQFSLVLVLR